MNRKSQLTQTTLVPPISTEIVQQKERGGMGEVLDPKVQWFLFWLRIKGEFTWMWHRARMQWCKRDDVGWVPMAMAECTEFKNGDHVWHGPFEQPVGDVEDYLPCPTCIDKHNALVGAQVEEDND